MREIIEYYDSQTEEEAAADLEAVADGYPMVEVPTELVDLVTSLITRYEQGTPLEILKEAIRSKLALVEAQNPE